MKALLLLTHIDWPDDPLQCGNGILHVMALVLFPVLFLPGIDIIVPTW